MSSKQQSIQVDIRYNSFRLEYSMDVTVMNRTNKTYEKPFDIEISSTIYAQEMAMAHFLPSIVFVAILMLIGVPGNFFAIVVYYKCKSKTTSRIFIITMATCDFIICCFVMPVELYMMFHAYQMDQPILCKLSRYSTYLINDLSSVILLVIALDRFFLLVRPFGRQITTQNALHFVFIALLLSILISWPALIVHGIQTFKSRPNDSNTYVTLKTCLIDEQILKTKYPLLFTILQVSCHLFADTVLIVLYSTIGYTVLHSGDFLRAHHGNERMMQLRQETSDPNNQSNGTLSRISARRSRMKPTLMLFLVTLLFIVSFVPYFVLALIRYINGKLLSDASDVNKAIYNLFFKSYFLGSTFNPVIYCFMNKDFRIGCKLFLLNILTNIRVLFPVRRNSDSTVELY